MSNFIEIKKGAQLIGPTSTALLRVRKVDNRKEDGLGPKRGPIIPFKKKRKKKRSIIAKES